mgnify:FL=1
MKLREQKRRNFVEQHDGGYEKQIIKRAELSVNKEDRNLLILRNIAVTVTAAVFFLAVFTHTLWADINSLLRAVAYLCGFVAYFLEILVLNDKFKIRPPFSIMYMPYLLGILYVVLGISYFLHWIG